MKGLVEGILEMRGLQIDKVEEKDQKKRKKAMEKQAIQGFRRKSLGRKLTDDEKDQRKAARKPIFKEIYIGVFGVLSIISQ